MNPRSLVLGGSVFVGRRLVDALVAAGHDVTILNRGVTPVELPPGVAVLRADRTRPEQVAEALGGSEWDLVFDVSGFVMAAGGVDVEAFLDVFESRTGCYLYVSSIMAYDQGLLGIVPWREDMATNRSGPSSYGGFKAVVETALLARTTSGGLPGVVVRPAAIYGPHNNIYDMETAMWLRLAGRRPVLIPHSGLVTASYGHVDDLCDAMIALSRSANAVGQVFNVTTSAITVNRYVETLAAIVGVEPCVVEISDDTLAELPAAPFGHLFGRAHHAVLSTVKLQQALPQLQPRSFERGHEETYEWFLSMGWDRLDSPLADPVWHSSWDFAWEAQVADRVSASRRRLSTQTGATLQ